MSTLRSPLVPSTISVLSDQISAEISSLESAVLQGEPLETLNTLCESIEESIRSFQSFNPSTSERQEHSRLLAQYKKNFNNIVAGLEKSVKLAPPINDFKFDEFDQQLHREKLAHTVKIQEKMVIVGDIMKDCAETVHQQGQVLDRIDIEIDKAEKYTGKAELELEKTSVRQKRKKCFCWSLMIVAFGFLVAIIITAVLVSRKR